MTKSISLSAIFVATLLATFIISMLGLAPVAKAASIVSTSTLIAGDLIRGQSFSAVYYFGKDGMRYVFPNDKTYFTWYSNFDNVKWLTDSDLATIQIGGNVTYKPGVKMIKINSDPKTYAISAGGMLRHIASESVAVALYGSDWNKKIDDVPDGFFPNYKISTAIDVASLFSVSGEMTAAMSINVDKNLKAATVVTIADTGFSPSSVTVSAGTAVKFVNSGTTKHTASADDNKWGTGTMNAGGAFIRYFKEAGTFSYSCAYHPSMKGTVVAQ
jgi:plastocyanin